jgi:glycosyltransferase involved in cell wall biosynthesis
MAATRSAILAAYKAGIPSLLTYHVSALTCANESMIRWNGELCDGYVNSHRCSACVVASHMPKGLAQIGMLAIALGRKLPKPFLNRLPRRAQLAFQLATGVEQTSNEVLDWLKKVTHFHVFNLYSAEVLRANGVSDTRISILSHGLDFQPMPSSRQKRDRQIHFVYTGRAHRFKGMEVFLGAISKIPRDKKAQFHFFGKPFKMDGPWEIAERLSRSDTRIRLHLAYNAEELPSILSQMDVMVVPSLCMETGPLIALEAMAAGKPIIGSNLPGINEMVQYGINGILFPPEDEQALAQIIMRVCEDPSIVQRLQSNLPKIKTIQDHAEEMIFLYKRIVEVTA